MSDFSLRIATFLIYPFPKPTITTLPMNDNHIQHWASSRFKAMEDAHSADWETYCLLNAKERAMVHYCQNQLRTPSSRLVMLETYPRSALKRATSQDPFLSRFKTLHRSSQPSITAIFIFRSESPIDLPHEHECVIPHSSQHSKTIYARIREAYQKTRGRRKNFDSTKNPKPSNTDHPQEPKSHASPTRTSHSGESPLNRRRFMEGALPRRRSQSPRRDQSQSLQVGDAENEKSLPDQSGNEELHEDQSASETDIASSDMAKHNHPKRNQGVNEITASGVQYRVPTQSQRYAIVNWYLIKWTTASRQERLFFKPKSSRAEETDEPVMVVRSGSQTSITVDTRSQSSVTFERRSSGRRRGRDESSDSEGSDSFYDLRRDTAPGNGGRGRGGTRRTPRVIEVD